MIRTTLLQALLLGLVLQASALGAVRVLHLSPDTPAVDVLAGLSEDSKGPLVQNLTYTNFTDYAPVPTGNYFIDVTPAGMPETVAIDLNDVALQGDVSYSVAAIGTLDGTDTTPLTALLLVDDAFVTDQAQLRVVHASPDAGLVDVLVNDAPVLTDFAFGTATDYLALDPGAYDISILEAGTTNELFSAEGLELSSGQVSTAFAIGTVAGGDFGVLITNDATAVPEPASAGLFALGSLLLAASRFRRQS